MYTSSQFLQPFFFLADSHVDCLHLILWVAERFELTTINLVRPPCSFKNQEAHTNNSDMVVTYSPSTKAWITRCFTDLRPSGPSLQGLWWVHWCWPLLSPPLRCRALRSCGLCDHSWWSLSTTSPHPSSVHDQRSHYTCKREEGM